MRKLGLLTIVLAMMFGLGGGTAAAADFPSTETFGFEPDWEDWSPATDGRAAGWDASRSTERPHTGDHSVRFWVNAGNDDGTVWAQRPCWVDSFGSVKVTVTFWLWAQGASTFNAWPVVAYAGEQRPTQEADFARIARTDKPGWQQYSYTKVVNAFSGNVWIAVGTSVTWEVNRTLFLDDITVTIEPPF